MWRERRPSLRAARQRGPVSVDPLGDVGVIQVVGRCHAGALRASLEQRPAKDRRPLMGQVPGGALAVGGIQGDVRAGGTGRALHSGHLSRRCRVLISSAFQRRIRVVQAPDDMVRLGVAMGEEIRASARCRRASWASAGLRIFSDAAGRAASCRLWLLRGREICAESFRQARRHAPKGAYRRKLRPLLWQRSV
jgi:hypothetical protein